MANSSDTGFPLLARLCLIAACFALVVIALGAATRLTDAGLGCPDWPGCYGHLVVPTSASALKTIDHMFPNKPVVAHKAWMEMVHRYCAGTLALLIAVIVVMAYRSRRRAHMKTMALTTALALVLLYQPILGMWTVTWKLLPIVVSQHLLGGFSLLALLVAHYFAFRAKPKRMAAPDRLLSRMAVLGLILAACQISLGAWTSTNYAAISCDSFPLCQMAPWHWQFKQAFTLFSSIGVNYDGGLLSLDAKRTIQMVHRIGAMVLGLYLFVFCVLAIWRKQRDAGFVQWLMLVMALLFLQVCLGIANVLLERPLWVAVLHNLTAASLLTAVVAVCCQLLQAGNGRQSAVGG